MRLVCPNCGAQYEVDDRVIPDGGRDVQCSNCGHGWFQRPAHWDEAAEAEDPDVAPEIEEPAAEEPAFSEPEPDPEPEDEADETSPAPDLPRRPLDDSVRGILEEEARREIEARASEGGSVETQPDLGLDAYEDPEEERRRVARERMARMRGIEEGETLEPEVAPEPEVPEEPKERKHGREVFPDIEEINSTLDTPAPPPPPIKDTSGDTDDEEVEASSGFARSFAIIVLLALVAFAIYYFAPQLVQSVPALEPALASYVDFVNGVFAQIDDWLQALIAKMESMAAPDQ